MTLSPAPQDGLTLPLMGTSPLHLMSVATFICREDKKITDKKMKLKGNFYLALQERPPGLRPVVVGTYISTRQKEEICLTGPGHAMTSKVQFGPGLHQKWDHGHTMEDPRPGHPVLSAAQDPGIHLCPQAHLLGALRSTKEHCRGRNSTAVPGRRWLDLHGPQALVCTNQNPWFPQRS